MEIFYKEELVKKVYELMDNSEKFLVIVTPFLKIWGGMYTKLENLSKKIKITFIVKDGNKELNFLESKAALQKLGIEVFSIRQLHAKIYINEKKAIIGSINLTESAFTKSEEIGGLTNYDEEYSKIYEITNILKSKINSVTEELHKLENEMNNIKFHLAEHQLIVEHEHYKLQIYMGNDNLIMNAYNICIDISSEYKINWIYKNIPKIKEEAFPLIFERVEDILKCHYTMTFYYPTIEELLKNDFDTFEYKIKFLIKAIDGFINN